MPKLVSSHPHIATTQEPHGTSLLEMSHHNTTQEEAPPQVKNNTEYHPNMRGILSSLPQPKRNIEFPLQKLKRSSESTVATREEYQVPPHNSGGALTPLLQLVRNPEFSASTEEEA